MIRVLQLLLLTTILSSAEESTTELNLTGSKQKIEGDISDHFYIFGHIHCQGKPAVNVRPFFQTPGHNDSVEVITTTDEKGFFSLITTDVFKGQKALTLSVHHKCPIDIEANCTAPVYWSDLTYELFEWRLFMPTNIYLDQLNNITRVKC